MSKVYKGRAVSSKCLIRHNNKSERLQMLELRLLLLRAVERHESLVALS